MIVADGARIFGLFSWSLCAPGQDEIRGQGANRCGGLLGATGITGLSLPRSDRDHRVAVAVRGVCPSLLELLFLTLPADRPAGRQSHAVSSTRPR